MSTTKFLLGALCCLGVLVLASLVIFSFSGMRQRWLNRQHIATACIDCQGRGFLLHQDRSLTFTGEGFSDSTPQTRQCPTCDGTGVIHR